MSVTGYENLTDEEIVMKLEKLKTAKYNLEREQRHRIEREKEERYKDIIGKIFYNKTERLLAKVTGVREPDVIGLTMDDVTKRKFICDIIAYKDDTGKFMMQSLFHKGLQKDNGSTIGEFDAAFWELIDEDKANEILNQWKDSINRVRF